ncbi:uncharacterized protein LOC129793681 [Lutzomyia longipalpis]|uniref:uncharacterized protein LOC129793681 n=1 Tax=Lutzomyia longipalpis TaxID=7200 RepID=UPI002483F720|nr:uncharacterized protein LOC129793681 [Lutzomyia longipalpis]
MPSVIPKKQKKGETPTMAYRRFLVMECGDDTPRGMAALSPFSIAKALDGMGRMKITLLKNHKLLIETQNPDQTAKILDIKEIRSVPVKVSEHPILNQSRGVIKCKEICSCNMEELLNDLKDQNVVKIKEIKRHMTDAEHAKCLQEKRKPSRMHTGSFVVTFSTPVLPPVLNIGYLKPEVKLYIPRPLRCFRCLRLGHTIESCKEKQPGKKKAQKCVNCSGDHESWSKQCPEYVKECTVLQLKAENGVPYRMAKVFVDFAGGVGGRNMQGRPLRGPPPPMGGGVRPPHVWNPSPYGPQGWYPPAEGPPIWNPATHILEPTPKGPDSSQSNGTSQPSAGKEPPKLSKNAKKRAKAAAAAAAAAAAKEQSQ